MSYYYHAGRSAVREFDDSQFAGWVASGNRKANGWILIADRPSELHDWTGAAWAIPSPVVRQMIRAEAMRRKAGGFLPTAPAGNTKWLPSDAGTLATLAMYGNATTLPAGIDIKTMGGTSYGLSAARVKSAVDAFAVQMAAIDAVEAAALAAQAANPATFDFSAIQWPAIYVPA